MLREKEIQAIKIKMLKKGMNQTKLSNILGVSSTSLSFCLKRKKQLKNVEEKVICWVLKK